MAVDLKLALTVGALIFAAGVAWATLHYRLEAVEKAEQFYHGTFDPTWAQSPGATSK